MNMIKGIYRMTEISKREDEIKLGTFFFTDAMHLLGSGCLLNLLQGVVCRWGDSQKVSHCRKLDMFESLRKR